MTDSSRFKGVSVKDPVSGESSIRRNSRTRLFITICCTQDSRPLQRSGRDPTRTISTIENKKRQIRQFFESVFPKPRRSMDILLCMLPTKRRIPPGKLILHDRAIGKHPTEGNVTIIAKCGYNCNTKRAIIYGPMEYGGANFRRLYDQQGIAQVQLFLRHWRTSTTAGKLLRCVVEWAQYCVGTSNPLMEHVQEDLPHLESRWLSSLREYLAFINAGLQLDNTGVAPLERRHDEFIMDRILSSKKFNRSEIKRLNYCRLFLGALTISDLATTGGNQLDHAKLIGQGSLFSTRPKWMKVHQELPSAATWQLWKRANDLWSNPDGTLIQPLGSWLLSNEKSRISHVAYTQGSTLYVRKIDGEYIKCRKLHHAQELYIERNISMKMEEIPRSASPVEIRETGREHQWRITYRSQRQNPRPPPAAATFEDYVQQLDPWEIDLLRHTELLVDPYTVCLELQQGFEAGSDGSEKFGTDGSFGWIISTSQGERAATGMGPSRGQVMDSYRAECSGMLSILRFLIRLSEYTNMVAEWQGIIGTDSQSMLDTILGRDQARPAASERTPLPTQQVPLDPLIPEFYSSKYDMLSDNCHS